MHADVHADVHSGLAATRKLKPLANYSPPPRVIATETAVWTARPLRSGANRAMLAATGASGKQARPGTRGFPPVRGNAARIIG